ncbi:MULTISPECIES: endonuclease III [Dehalococcoides]|jgi:endonuclease-3|uniref:Endonuclease III n=1 Tax=Dehalococcoides mccartyi (strain CBDB1) TaxID=255470 RepID=A0A916NYR6_DEHMC|nr:MULTISPECIES: endonuclease III [Dehalococcoides]AGG06480.1 endonuclease III [Dehalococcoides mccartyi DCMB5]AGG07919.1 endonuclease III [Dehalococcoides mccartyi BTF08]AQW62469.1 endonuclease III [Dehalococcoides mccartyi]AQX73269.1 endonuclease III [Dehalococcoides mccartyi]AQX74667.1 endonuclease III [Dehalococcoides mccartyi]
MLVENPEKQALEIIKRLSVVYPDAKTALNFTTPFEMLVATILSAQSTDKMINKITPALFEKYPDPKAFAEASLAELEQDIKSSGFFHNKAANIIGAARGVVSRFGGVVPSGMADMLTLPGVGRKTANVVLHNAFGLVEGIAVDTHVKRLTERLGLTSNTDPVKIEQDLMALLPRTYWGDFSYYLIDHGRAVCDAKKPHCPECVLKDICPSAFLFIQAE